MDARIKKALTDEVELTKLLQDLEPYVLRLAYHLTHHRQDAEDIAQDVLYKICTKLATFRGDSSLQTWVYSLVFNTYRDLYRKKKIRQHDPLPEQVPSGVPSFEEEINCQLEFESLLHDLPEVDRQVLILRFQNDLPVKEVATIMKLSEANVKTRVFRLKDRLKSYFSAEVKAYEMY